MGEMSAYDLEQRIIALEKRMSGLELEIRDKIGKSLMDLAQMNKEHSDALDQMTMLMAKLTQAVFPNNTAPDTQKIT